MRLEVAWVPNDLVGATNGAARAVGLDARNEKS
jgi:hypothetical protein